MTSKATSIPYPPRVPLAHIPTPLEPLKRMSGRLGVDLDPVYTGKAFFGLVQELRRNAGVFGDQIVFLHTGGIFGLFPKANELAPLLR